MRPICRKLFCILLTAVCAFGSFAFAASAAEAQPSLTILCANVAGLPIPMLFSGRQITVMRSQTEFGKILNESGADVVCVQEDFQFHDRLAQQMTAYAYQTRTSGGIPAGDGLNVFSKYPIYNVERVAWTAYYGILKHDNDALTPKGFLKCTLDADGVLIDLYNIHTDASKTTEDQLAKKAQFLQLKAYIDAHSAGRPVLITGDFNCTLHTYYYAEFYETMLCGTGFQDAWVEVVNDGNYLRGDDAEDVIARYNAQYNDRFWGLWDSYERLLYRGGDGVSFTATEHAYTFYRADNRSADLYSDHAVMRCTVTIDDTDYTRPALDVATQQPSGVKERLIYTVRMVFRCLGLILTDLRQWMFCGQPLT